MVINKSTSKKLSIILTLAMLFSLLVPVMSFAATPTHVTSSTKLVVTSSSMNQNDTQDITANAYYKKSGDMGDLFYKFEVKAPSKAYVIAQNFSEECTYSFTPENYGTYSIKVSVVTHADFTKYKGKVPSTYTKTLTKTIKVSKAVVVEDVVVTADPASVSVEAAQTATVILTANKGADEVTGVTYKVNPSAADKAIATATVAGNCVTVTGVAAGSYDLTVTATKTGETIAPITIPVTVTAPPAPETLKIDSVTAVTKYSLNVKFSMAVDAAKAENFSIDGVSIESATLNADKTMATLAVKGTKANASYKVVATGIYVNGILQPVASLDFTMPSSASLFNIVLSLPDGFKALKADGADKTLITAKVVDSAGALVTGAGDVELSFSATYGSLAEKRVTVQNGIATVMLTSEFLTKSVTSDVIAQVVEAGDTDLIGVKNDISVTITPNPDDVQVGQKPVITSAEANQADRVVAYFDRAVTMSYFANPGVNFVVKTRVNNFDNAGTTGDAIKVIGLEAVEGNNKALTLVLDTKDANFPLQDNDNVWVGLVDSTNGVTQNSNAPEFKLTDARQPSMLSVTAESLNTLKVTFSEAMDANSTTNGNNWSIDGTKLSTDYTITLGDYDAKSYSDTRHVVTIKKNVGYMTSGTHSIQASTVGDWAALSDGYNYAETQTLDFSVVPDESVPTAIVEVQSPEQWLVTFDKVVNEGAADAVKAIDLQKLNTATNAWELVTAPNYIVNKIDNNKFLVETMTDWTVVYNTAVTKKNYFNDSYRLAIKADSFTNVANGKKNLVQNLPLGGAMLTPDVKSPSIDLIEEVTKGTAYKATMSEPVKLSAVANVEGITLAQNQTNLPVPTAEFIKKDNTKTIQATIAVSFVDTYDKVLSIVPNQALEAGTWTLVIRSISDDVGNTASTATKDFTIDGVITGGEIFSVDWAFADVDKDLYVQAKDANDEDNAGDYVYVKYTAPFAYTGDFVNALKTSNYTFDGKELPVGSQITAGIKGYDDNVTNKQTVTIKLPNGWLGGFNAPHVLNISKFLQSAKNTVISGDLELKLSYKIADGLLTAPSTGLPAEVASYTSVLDPVGNTVVTATIKPEFVGKIQSVTIKGQAASASPDGTMYRVTLNGAVSVVSTDITVTQKVAGAVDAVNTAVAFLGAVSDTNVWVTLKAGVVATSVTVNGQAMTLSNGTYKKVLYGISAGSTVTVVVTTADGTQTKTVTVTA